MRFTETKVKGAYIIDVERREDCRGFFARSWCTKEFERNRLNPRVVQINVGFTARKAGLRGLHYQVAPHAEAKTIRCTQGAVFDVVLDLRPGSPTHKQWDAIELSARNHRMLYIPEGCAHGYQTLADDSEIEYLTTAFYAAESARGIRFNDPAFQIKWPLAIDLISDTDKSWPDYEA
jgi:dTDP-4-dehydrorhamnose 3,5-epimerase